MSMQASLYANKEGKADGGRKNRARVVMNTEDAQALVDGKKEAVTELRKSLAEALKGTE